MSAFRYQAIAADGNAVSGTIEAEDRKASIGERKSDGTA